jgi:type II secretory pathway pseudopilin PulG
MIVVAIIALLAAIAIPNLLRQRVNAAETYAQASLKTISAAYESYAAKEGTYNETLANLADTTVYDPPYLNKDFSACTAAAPCQGYAFSCTPAVGSYSCSATAEAIMSGKASDYSITQSGGITDLGVVD